MVKREESRGHDGIKDFKDLPWSHYAKHYPEHVDHVVSHVSNLGGPIRWDWLKI